MGWIIAIVLIVLTVAAVKAHAIDIPALKAELEKLKAKI
jgi:hypothetical protein